VFSATPRRAQARELVVLGVLYLIQNLNAEMLRLGAAGEAAQRAGTTSGNPVASWSFVLANRVHPVAMVIFGLWLTVMVLAQVRSQTLPRWTFDGLGAWFTLRLLAEYITINGLIFEGSRVPPGLLLGQIVLYLPFFVITWGWIFQRLDYVGRQESGRVVQLIDADPSRGITPFDYYHSSISTLLNKGKPTIVGVSRNGRLVVLLYMAMVLGLYALTFARILQLTRAVI